MRFVFSLFMLLATVMAPTQALPTSTGGACDITAVFKHSKTGTTQATTVQVSAATVAPGGTTTITLANANGFTGFLMYVTDPNQAGNAAHVGQLTSTGPAQTASVDCANGPNPGTTVGHNSANAKTALSWTWTAPTAPGTYTVTALVAESAAGTPPLLNVAPVTITVAAPATPAPTVPPTVPPPPPATTAPAKTTTAPATTTTAPATTTTTAPATTTTTAPVTTGTTAPATTTTGTTAPVTTTGTTAPTTGTTTTTATTAPTKPNTVQQAFTMVIVKLKAVLNGTGTVAQLKAAIQNLIAQIQAAIQKAKAAKNMANANAPVQMIVTKAPSSTGIAAAAATAGSSYQIGFANAADAAMFATLVTDASSPGSQSQLATSGDLASQITADPTAVNTTTGQVQVQPAQQVTMVTCSDGTMVTQDLQAVMCPATTVAPASTATTGAIPIGNAAFIGIIIGGVVLLFVIVGGAVYYQKSKSTKTTVAPRV